MSWSCSTPKVEKQQAGNDIDAVMPGGLCDGPTLDQLAAAKRAAKELLKSVPGPYVIVSMSGHANGIGWQEKVSYANDTISVSVTQLFD